MIKRLSILMLSLWLFACTNQPMNNSYDENIHHMRQELETGMAQNAKEAQAAIKNATLPNSIAQALMPTAVKVGDTKDGEQRFDIEVNDVSAQVFFAGLAKDASYSLVVSPKVSGNITLALKQASLLQVLQTVRDMYGYRYQRTAYGYNIFPKELETRIFIINHLALSRTSNTEMRLSTADGNLVQAATVSDGGEGGQNLATSSIKTAQEDTFWADLKATLETLVATSEGEEGSLAPAVNIAPATGVVIIKAYPKEMDMAERYIKRTQNIVNREVIIEAQILDVELKRQYSSGIDWSVLTASGATTSDNISSPESGLLGNVYKLSMSGDQGNFTYAIQLLASQGKVSVISKPRVSAVNNQNAIIKVGEEEYFVTNVSSEVTTSSDTDSTTSTIQLTPFFSGISLDVTPQITSSNQVNLRIHPAITRVSQDDKSITVNGTNNDLPLAKSQIRETDTVVRANDGQVIIIGGLMESDIGLSESGLPIDEEASGIFGNFTKAKLNYGTKNELVILMRAVIVKDGVWQQELDQTANVAYKNEVEEGFLQDDH